MNFTAYCIDCAKEHDGLYKLVSKSLASKTYNDIHVHKDRSVLIHTFSHLFQPIERRLKRYTSHFRTRIISDLTNLVQGHLKRQRSGRRNQQMNQKCIIICQTFRAEFLSEYTIKSHVK
jgi:hypothetical protein